MIEQRLYVDEKLHELASSRPPRPMKDARPPGQRRPHVTRRAVAPLARLAGRGARRIGEAIESWAAPHPAA